jgi:hypothetical protein
MAKQDQASTSAQNTPSQQTLSQHARQSTRTAQCAQLRAGAHHWLRKALICAGLSDHEAAIVIEGA